MSSRFVLRRLLALIMLITVASCGSNAKVGILLSGEASVGLQNPAVSDVVFVVSSLNTDGRALDLDRDGQADVFVFPERCGPSQAPLCGFPPNNNPAEIRLGSLTLDFRYQVEVKLRNSQGNTLYQGTTEFLYNQNAADLVISVMEVN